MAGVCSDGTRRRAWQLGSTALMSAVSMIDTGQNNAVILRQACCQPVTARGRPAQEQDAHFSSTICCA